MCNLKLDIHQQIFTQKFVRKFSVHSTALYRWAPTIAGLVLLNRCQVPFVSNPYAHPLLGFIHRHSFKYVAISSTAYTSKIWFTFIAVSLLLVSFGISWFRVHPILPGLFRYAQLSIYCFMHCLICLATKHLFRLLSICLWPIFRALMQIGSILMPKRHRCKWPSTYNQLFQCGDGAV